MKAMFHIYQYDHCWQIVATSLADAVKKWRERGAYPDDSLIQGKPDKIIRK